MNTIDKKYTDLLQDILDNGVTKQDRTGTGTLSVFGRQIRHKMSEGFPLLTTKKMYFKGIVTELLWFLRGDTNIKFLVDNDCHIWDGDAYKNHTKTNVVKNDDGSETHISPAGHYNQMTKEEFINKIKTDDEFAKKFGDLGPIYGKQWRSWTKFQQYEGEKTIDIHQIDQIANLINDLKTNPDSRRLMVSAWNPSDLEESVLPPCHYGFQVYTRELSLDERIALVKPIPNLFTHEDCDAINLPKRSISLMYNARSQDVPLGTPFNLASYGLLLEIIAKEVNMVPDELITNMGDCHIYLNQIDGVKEQIGRDFSLEERNEIHKNLAQHMRYHIDKLDLLKTIDYGGGLITHEILDELDVPKRKRQPFPLPKLVINDEFWNQDDSIFNQIEHIKPEDFFMENYQSHPTIKMPLSN